MWHYAELYGNGLEIFLNDRGVLERPIFPYSSAFYTRVLFVFKKDIDISSSSCPIAYAYKRMKGTGSGVSLGVYELFVLFHYRI